MKTKCSKKEILKNRLLNLKNCLEVAQDCINAALNNLSSLDDVDEILDNFNFYTESCGKCATKRTVKYS